MIYDDDLPVEVHRIGVNGHTYDHRDPHGKTWRLRRTTGDSWWWFISTTVLTPESVKCRTCGGLGWIVEDQTWGQPEGEQHQCPDCVESDGLT